MKVADVIIRTLKEENVKTVFGYPGAAIMALYESLRTSDIHHVLVRQEQAAGHSASGYARITGEVGVCIVTSGPGATNLITGIATAYMDSIPLVIITGQVKSNLIGRDVFQEVDITGATEPFIKHSYLIKDATHIPQIMKEAFYIAKTGRPGPVLIDIPADIFEEQIDYVYPKKICIRGYKPTLHGHMGQIKRAMKVLQQSKRPLICVGGGVNLAKAEKEIIEFIEKTNIPVVETFMGLGAVPTNSPYNIGMIGTHGYAWANRAVRKADTVLFIGARIADRAITSTEIFAKDVEIIHVDVDPAEIGKNTYATIPVVGDVKYILNEMLNLAQPLDTKEWLEEIRKVMQSKEEKHEFEGYVNPKIVIQELSKLLSDDAIIAADVGQNQMWTARNMEIKGTRKLLGSGGFGTMGYSLPCAIGAGMAAKDRKVVSIMGDGSFQMSLFELATIIQEGLKPLIILFNNSKLGMVHEMQYKKYNKEYGVDLTANPDFIMLAKAYGIQATQINNPNHIVDILKQGLDYDGPFLIECIVSPRESTL